MVLSYVVSFLNVKATPADCAFGLVPNISRSHPQLRIRKSWRHLVPLNGKGCAKCYQELVVSIGTARNRRKDPWCPGHGAINKNVESLVRSKQS